MFSQVYDTVMVAAAAMQGAMYTTIGGDISAIIVASIFGAAIAVLAGMAPAFGQGLALGRAVEAIGRQPEAAGQIRTMFLLGAVVAETGAIYGLFISIILIFVNPFVDMYQAAMGL